MAHRLELALKESLRGTYFDVVDNMLLKMYYLILDANKIYS